MLYKKYARLSVIVEIINKCIDMRTDMHIKEFNFYFLTDCELAAVILIPTGHVNKCYT